MVMKERQEKIINILMNQDSATVAELSELFDVTPVTIRSDLNQMAEDGRILRTHGGARLAGEKTRQEYSFAAQQRINAPQKQLIGRTAASLVQPGESILLDASTTAFAVGQFLKKRSELYNVTVVTTGIWTALELLGAPHLDIVLTGGHLRTAAGSITGFIAHDILNRFNFQKVFLGAWGITLEEGLMDAPMAEVDLKRTIISRSQELIAVIDGSKFGRTSLAPFAAPSETSLIITDNSTPLEMQEKFQLSGINLLIVNETI